METHRDRYIAQINRLIGEVNDRGGEVRACGQESQDLARAAAGVLPDIEKLRKQVSALGPVCDTTAAHIYATKEKTDKTATQVRTTTDQEAPLTQQALHNVMASADQDGLAGNSIAAARERVTTAVGHLTAALETIQEVSLIAHHVGDVQEGGPVNHLHHSTGNLVVADQSLRAYIATL